MPEPEYGGNNTDIFKRTTLVCIAITAGISGIAILGWILDMLIVTRVSPEYIPMAPSTAISFFILSIALLVYTRRPCPSLNNNAAKVGTIFIFLVTFIILVEFFTGSKFDIENLLLPNPEKLGQVPIGRMSPLTAIDLLLASSTLLLLLTSKEGKQRTKDVAAFLATLVFLLGFVYLLGYLYGTPLLYGGTVVPVALTTAVAFVFLGIGLISSTGGEYWPMSSFVGSSVYARLMRSFLPVVVLLVLINGWLNVTIFPIIGNYVLSNTLVALLFAIVIGIIVLKISKTIGGDIDRANEARVQAEEELKQYHDHLEEMVKERTSQLELANKELESFSYSISHDLRSPLRSIDGFSQALLEDYPDKLDEKGKDYLNRVRFAAQKMAKLIDAILSLSRLTRGEMKRSTVDLTGMVKSVTSGLKIAHPDRNVEFVIAENVTANCDAMMLQIVFENLIGNACKFTEKHPTARIEFGVTEKNGKTVYFVKDDGAGFGMEYADKLFTAFHRLHTESEFTGIGIGLATVQRIIHRHGGEIWAEGEVEKGATFYFTLE